METKTESLLFEVCAKNEATKKVWVASANLSSSSFPKEYLAEAHTSKDYFDRDDVTLTAVKRVIQEVRAKYPNSIVFEDYDIRQYWCL